VLKLEVQERFLALPGMTGLVVTNGNCPYTQRWGVGHPDLSDRRGEEPQYHRVPVA
jgi:hypothetical protein